LATNASLTVGCASFERGYDGWEGHPVDDLLRAWGSPDSTLELSDNYVAYTWRNIEGDGACEQTFVALHGKIVNYTDKGCVS